MLTNILKKLKWVLYFKTSRLVLRNNNYHRYKKEIRAYSLEAFYNRTKVKLFILTCD